MLPEEVKPPVPEPPKGPTGTIAGTVKFTGTAPERQKIQNGADPYCARFELTTETVIVNDNQTLRDVLVRVKPGAVPAYTPQKPVVVDQVQCMYRPRVQAAVVGQTLEVRNSDQTTHNIHAWSTKLGSREEMESLFNRGQPKAAPPLTGPILPDIDVYSIRCDQHAWMRGYVVVSDNPYAAVTGADGSFKIDNAPVGSYTLQAWHALYGVKTAEVTVAEGKTAEVSFTFEAKDKPAGG
jgi:plastocyanin